MPREDDEVAGLEAGEAARVDDADLVEALLRGLGRRRRAPEACPNGLRVRDEDDRPAVLVRGPDRAAVRARPGAAARAPWGAWTCRRRRRRRLVAGTLRNGSRTEHRARDRRDRGPLLLSVLGDRDRRRRAADRDDERRERDPHPVARVPADARGSTCGAAPARRPGDDRERKAALRQYRWSSARAAPQRGQVPSAAAIASRRSRGRARHGFGAGSITVCSHGRRDSTSSDRPQFGQKWDPRRIGAPHSQRATLAAIRAAARRSPPSRASMPTTTAARSCEQVVAEAAAAVHLDEQPAEVAQRRPRAP